MKVTVAIAACLLLCLVGCSPAPKPHDPVGVVRAEFDAINRGQVDVATNYFADDGQIVTAYGQPRGKEKIKSFVFSTLIKMKSRFKINELVADGANVTGTLNLNVQSLAGNSEGSGLYNLKAVVQDGKIITIEWGTAAKSASLKRG